MVVCGAFEVVRVSCSVVCGWCLVLQDAMIDSLLDFAIEYKDRVKMELIKPAVDWRKSGTKVATSSAAVAKQ